MSGAALCSECQYPIRAWHCRQGFCDHRQHCTCDHNGREVRVIGEVDGLEVTAHAAHRWQERTKSAPPPCTIEHAWRQGVPVGGENLRGATARWFVPEGVVLIAHTGRLRSVLRAEWVDGMTIAHLDECEDCGRHWDPSKTDECPWCDGESDVQYAPVEGAQWRPREPPQQTHPCPECGTETLGFDVGNYVDPRCKVCYLRASRRDRQPSDPAYCAEAGCYEVVEGARYCELHALVKKEQAALTGDDD
jgi:hypothetical protein